MKMIRVSDAAHRALKMEAAARQGTITTLVDELLGRLGKMVVEAPEVPPCPHPRDKVVPASVGGVLVCGLCGEEVSYD